MIDNKILEILPLIQQPSRYLGNEINSVKKKWNSVEIHFALAFPDLYEIGSSHFGIQILYNILNKKSNILAERVFAPAMDLEYYLRKNNIPLFSLESKKSINEFDIVGFSLLYELNYTNMINMLDLSKIPLLSKERSENDAIIIAGGPCTCNPEPIADFFDAIVVGDGEYVLMEMVTIWKNWKFNNKLKRQDLLEAWSHLKGVYIPNLFEVKYNDYEQILIPKSSWHHFIDRTIIPDINKSVNPENPIIPYGKPIHDRLRIEIARGCTRGCRFCQAGMIYRPVREREPDNILSIIQKSLMQTGYEDLSLLSLSTGDYSCIQNLIKTIIGSVAYNGVSISLPSLRAGSISEELMDCIRKVRKTGFTIAPEAGSQRLRDVINKNIDENDIISTVKSACLMGWKIIKLYFMIGLPTEEQKDIIAIVDLIKKIKYDVFNKGNIKINASFSTFVPKPNTPFQWEPQIDLKSAQIKLEWLKENLKFPNVTVKWQDPRVSKIEAVLARGNRKISKAIIEAWKDGCRFDGWSDYFNFNKWVNAFQKSEINYLQFTDQKIDIEQRLPWDHINSGIKKEYFIIEKVRALKGIITNDCRTGSCSGCGICDFKEIKPVSYHKNEEFNLKIDSDIKNDIKNNYKYIVKFLKKENARFIGHLELVNIFIRALRRMQFPIEYSNGFHPMPKISFIDSLPIGIESIKEEMIITMNKYVDKNEITKKLNKTLPEGIKIIRTNFFYKKENKKYSYFIRLKDGFFDNKKFEKFNNSVSFNIEKKNKKGKISTINLKNIIEKMTIRNEKDAIFTIKSDNKIIIRPDRILKQIFGLDNLEIMNSKIIKIKDA